MAFEIARRHRFVGDLAALPDTVEVHVMPTGQLDPPRYNDLSALRYRAGVNVAESIERAYAASAAYLTRVRVRAFADRLRAAATRRRGPGAEDPIAARRPAGARSYRVSSASLRPPSTSLTRSPSCTEGALLYVNVR